MSSNPSTDRTLSSAFLVSLFEEKSITEVNLVFDNAKPRATSIFLQSTNKREDKSSSRWDSIQRSKSLDGLDRLQRRQSRTTPSYNPERRRLKNSHSLSPTSLVPGHKLLSSKDFDKSISSSRRTNATSNLPPVFRQQMLEIFRTDEMSRKKASGTSGLLGSRRDADLPLRKPMGRGYSSESSLRMPQRKAFIDSDVGRSKPRRAGRRGSFETSASMKSPPSSRNARWQLSNVHEDGNETDSTLELTPSPHTPLDAAAKILKLANHPIQAPPLNSPELPTEQKTYRRKSAGSLSRLSKATRAELTKSPPPPPNFTPPPLRRGQRKSPRRSIRPKSPPLRRSATPPSLSHALKDARRHSDRRHSDSAVNVDMEISQKLLHLALSSSPKQPMRRASFDTWDSHDTTSDQDFDSDQEEEYETISSFENETSPESSKASKGNRASPSSRVRFSPQVQYSQTQPKKNPNPFSTRRQYSVPLTDADASLKNDSKEGVLTRRKKSLSPGSSSSKTIVTTSTTGATKRVRKNVSRTSSNRDIVKASFREHSPESEGDLEYWFEDPEMGHTKPSIVDLLGAPPLESPPQKGSKMKNSSNRSSSLSNIPQLPSDAIPNSGKKNKKNRRRAFK